MLAHGDRTGWSDCTVAFPRRDGRRRGMMDRTRVRDRQTENSLGRRPCRAVIRVALNPVGNPAVNPGRRNFPKRFKNSVLRPSDPDGKPCSSILTRSQAFSPRSRCLGPLNKFSRSPPTRRRPRRGRNPLCCCRDWPGRIRRRTREQGAASVGKVARSQDMNGSLFQTGLPGFTGILSAKQRLCELREKSCSSR